MTENDTGGEAETNDTRGEAETDATTHRDSIRCAIGEDERPSAVAVRAVGTVTDTPILDLDPLYDTIDPEYVDTLTDTREESAIEDSSVSFRYSGCLVTVNQTTVHVRSEGD